MRLRKILPNNAGAIEPKPPLTPETARRAPERKAGASKRIRERQSACAKKPRDLRPDL